MFFDLRFGFLVKNCIYGQILVNIDQNPVKLIKELNIFINLNLGLHAPSESIETYSKSHGNAKPKPNTPIHQPNG